MDTLTDPRQLFATATTTAGDLIATIADNELHLATPCDGFDVAGLLGHLEIVLRRVITLADGSDPMAMPETVPTPADGWHANWLRWTDHVAAAWADPAKLDEIMTLPWVTGPGGALLGTYTAELTVHTWDVARAVGREVAWDEQVLTAAVAAYQRVLPEPNRDDRFAGMREHMPAGWQPPFRNAVDLPADAPTIDRIVAWTGRQP
ncbi:MAG: TIGR03086 family metal-binding protein [Ilumatobacteraceae bacterium]